MTAAEVKDGIRGSVDVWTCVKFLVVAPGEGFVSVVSDKVAVKNLYNTNIITNLYNIHTKLVGMLKFISLLCNQQRFQIWFEQKKGMSY